MRSSAILGCCCTHQPESAAIGRANSPMRVLVLGATGFIGGQIARALLERGYIVRALRRSSSSTLAIDGLPIEFAYGDLRDRRALVAAMRGVEAVCHAARSEARRVGKECGWRTSAEE